MRIVILESSPNRHGSSNLLAERFAQGAQEAGHQLAFVDVAHAHIHPCTGCGTPAMTARSPFPQAAYRLGRQLL